MVDGGISCDAVVVIYEKYNCWSFWHKWSFMGLFMIVFLDGERELFVT